MGVAFSGFLALLGEAGHELARPFGKKSGREADRQFAHHMTAHHQVGIRMLKLAVAKGVRPEFLKLNELMLVEHLTQTEILCKWWKSWCGGDMPDITPHHYVQMPGMPAPAASKELEHFDGLAFETRYLPLMIFHHEGGIQMAVEKWQRGSDPRRRLWADQIRHSQRGQVERMHELNRILQDGDAHLDEHMPRENIQMRRGV